MKRKKKDTTTQPVPRTQGLFTLYSPLDTLFFRTTILQLLVFYALFHAAISVSALISRPEALSRAQEN